MNIPKPGPPKPSQPKVEPKQNRRPQKRKSQAKTHAKPIKDEPKLSEHLMRRPFADALKDYLKKESN
jgi:hypothetical protein